LVIDHTTIRQVPEVLLPFISGVAVERRFRVI